MPARPDRTKILVFLIVGKMLCLIQVLSIILVQEVIFGAMFLTGGHSIPVQKQELQRFPYHQVNHLTPSYVFGYIFDPCFLHSVQPLSEVMSIECCIALILNYTTWRFPAWERSYFCAHPSRFHIALRFILAWIHPFLHRQPYRCQTSYTSCSFSMYPPGRGTMDDEPFD